MGPGGTDQGKLENGFCRSENEKEKNEKKNIELEESSSSSSSSSTSCQPKLPRPPLMRHCISQATLVDPFTLVSSITYITLVIYIYMFDFLFLFSLFELTCVWIRYDVRIKFYFSHQVVN